MSLTDIRSQAAYRDKNSISDRSFELTVNGQDLFSNLKISVDDGEKGSSIVLNKLIDSITDEITIQERSVQIIESQYKYWIENKLAQLRSLSRKIDTLFAQAEDMLLVQDKTDGFFYSVGDDFKTYDFIEAESSTAMIDVGNGVVFANKTPNVETSELEQITVVPTIGFDLTSERSPDISGSLPGFELSKIYDRSLDSAWIYEAQFSSALTTPVIGSILFDFKEIIEANYLNLISTNSLSDSPYLLDVIVSSDSINWQSILTGFSLGTGVTIPLSVQSFRYLRIFLTLTGPTENRNNRLVYQFHLKEIQLFKHKFMTESILYTKPMAINDEDGNTVNFTSLALKTCDIVPTGTDLECYVAFGQDGVFGSFQQITPINKNGSPLDLNQTIDYGISSNVLDNSIKFPYNYNNNKTLNFQVTDSISVTGLTVLRDIGNWSINNNWYTLAFYLESSVQLDFRTFNVYLNGKFKNNLETYPAGFYILRINDNSNLAAIKSYISTKTLHIGGYIATRVDISEFLKLEEDNYNYFAITPGKTVDPGPFTQSNIMLKKLTENEAFEVIYINTNTNEVANSLKLKFVFITDSTFTLTPVLDQYQIKVNKIL